MADEILSIADASERDFIQCEDGSLRPDHELVARSRLRVDSRKWLLSKMQPHLYGERLELNGKDGGPLRLQFVGIPGDENL